MHERSRLDTSLQQLVADAVTERVVHRLEAIQVQEHHRDPRAAALGQRQRLRDAVAQQLAVGKIGEGIVVGEMVHSLLALLALGDVGEDLDVVAGPALRIAHHADGEPLEEHVAVAAPIPHFALPVAVAIHFRPHLALAVGAAHAGAQRVRRLADGVGRACSR